jgi:hypothetical protein
LKHTRSNNNIIAHAATGITASRTATKESKQNNNTTSTTTENQ